MKIVDIAPKRTTGVPRDGLDRPMIVPKEGGTPKAHTRVTTFIDCIEDKSSLSDWHKRMTMRGASLKPKLLEGLAELDMDDPDTNKVLMRRAESALAAAGTHEKADRGTRYHELTEYVDRGEQLPVCTDVELADMAAYMAATVNLTPVHREVFTVCSELGVGGTPDSVSWYDGPGPNVAEDPEDWLTAMLITDLKTGRVDYGGLKMPAQLAIYAHSEFYDPSYAPFPDRKAEPKLWEKWKKGLYYREEIEPAYTPLGPVNQEWGLVLHLEPGSGKCDLHWANLTLGWEVANMATTIRAMRSRKSEGMKPWLSAAVGTNV